MYCVEVAVQQDAPAGVGGASVVKLYAFTKTEEASSLIESSALEGVFVCLFI